MDLVMDVHLLMEWSLSLMRMRRIQEYARQHPQEDLEDEDEPEQPRSSQEKVGLRLNHKLWRMKKPSWRVTKEHQVICICLDQFDNVLQKLKLANEVHNQKVKAVRQSLCVLIPTQRSQNPVQSSRERLCIAQLLQEI